jgi:hypothetical protein
MKNIHILPTDKPSRLIIYSTLLNEFRLLDEPIDDWKHKRHIYITSNEDPKNKDYYWDENKLKVKRYFEDRESFPSLLHRFKVILTTDPKLIADGVQAIDDEFIQWFVKNPSCEEVEVQKEQINNKPGSSYTTITIYKYKIITSQEEPKQHVEYINNNIEEFEGKLKEFKQVTSIDWLEKQLDNNDFSNHQMEVNISMSLPKYIEIFKQSKEMYNQERMYSEEDLKQSYSQGWMTRERFDDLSPEIVYPDGLDYEEKQEYAFNLWFNQFKKK